MYKAVTYRLQTQVFDKAGNSSPATVELAIDWTELAFLMAKKANGNKSRRSSAFHGIVKASLRGKTK